MKQKIQLMNMRNREEKLGCFLLALSTIMFWVAVVVGFFELKAWIGAIAGTLTAFLIAVLFKTKRIYLKLSIIFVFSMVVATYINLLFNLDVIIAIILPVALLLSITSGMQFYYEFKE